MEDMAQLNIVHLINVRWYNACAYYALALAAAQKRLGHNVLLAGDGDNPYISLARDWGLEFDLRPQFSSYFPNLIKNLMWLRKLSKEKGFEIVVAHRGEAHVAAALAKMIFGLDYVLIRVRGDVRPPRSDSYNRLLYGKATDGIICPTDKHRRRYLKTFRIDSSMVITIPAGIEYEHYRKPLNQVELKGKYGIKDGDRVVTILGRLSPIKGHEVFIRMAGLLNDLRNVHFLIAGKEYEVRIDDLHRLIDKYGDPEKFTIIGQVDDVRAILQITDIAVIPSLGSEMIARVALEFMASGKPIVASNVNALAEIIDDGEGGFLVKAGDIDGFANAVKILLDDTDRRDSFGTHNLLQAQTRFSTEKWAQDSINFYKGFLR